MKIYVFNLAVKSLVLWRNSENNQVLDNSSSYFADCPLDLSGSNFTLAASLCSNKDDRGKCCRYINAFIAVSVARYANRTSYLGVASNFSDTCLHSISQTMELYGVPKNATVFCGFGTKIPVNYECEGRKTVTQMLQSPKFMDVMQNCKVPFSAESSCRKCLNAGIVYLHRLVGTSDNITLSTCRDATYAALASQVDDASAVNIAACFFGVQGLNIPPGISFYFYFLVHLLALKYVDLFTDSLWEEFTLTLLYMCTGVRKICFFLYS